jgi:hypothetical protein
MDDKALFRSSLSFTVLALLCGRAAGHVDYYAARGFLEVWNGIWGDTARADDVYRKDFSKPGVGT